MKSQATLPRTAREWPPVPTEIIAILERLFPPVGSDTRPLSRPEIDYAQGANSVVQKLRRVHDDQRSP